MPGTGLKNVRVLGDELEYSKPMFQTLFQEPQYMPRFKGYVETSPDRFKNRAFSREATWSEAGKAIFRGKTNYQVILREVLANESKGSLSLVGNFRFLINASHAAVRAHSATPLSFMASGQVVPKDYLHQPVHRLLLEEHVYAFVWSPTLSKSYHALMAAVALAKLTSATVTAVATFGAATPLLIDSLQSAAHLTNDLIKLKGAVSDAVSQLLDIKDGVGAVVETLGEARSQLSALSSGGDIGSEHLMSPASGTLDITASPISSEPKKVKRLRGLLSPRMQTQEEADRDARKKLVALMEELQKLNYVVVQQITPLVQLSDNVEVTSADPDVISFNLKTYLAKRALVRVGETDGFRFNQMVAAAKGTSLAGNAETFLYPWSTADKFLQFMRLPWEEGPRSQPYPLNSSIPFVHWDDIRKQEWELVAEKSSTQPIPDSIRVARAKVEAAARARVAAADAALAKRSQRLRSLAQLAKKNLHLMTANAEKARMEKIAQAFGRAQLPSPDDFVRQTTTQWGPFTNSRHNPKLLLIDSALKEWEKSKKFINTPDGLRRVKMALLSIQMSCEDFIQSKVHASRRLTGHLSERIAPVHRLREAAIQIYETLPES
jgi:hypothetical protein